MRIGPALPAVTAASFVAGPLFVTSTVVALLYLQLPKAVTLELLHVAQFSFVLIMASLIGFLPSFAMNLVGTGLMTGLSGLYRPALRPEAWMAAGAVIGAAVAACVGANLETAFALVTTSAVCARICRKGADAD